MAIAVLIGVMIAIVVGISLIPTIQSSVSTITDATTTAIVSGTTTTTPVYSSAVRGLAGVLPIVFVAVIILGAVAYMGFSDGEGPGIRIPWFHRREETSEEKRQKSLRNRCLEASNKLAPYINNLDTYLGIKTQVVGNGELSLVDNNLYIAKDVDEGGEYHWYITAKHSTEPAFKVVGLNMKDASKNVAYILGKNENVPYLIEDKTEGALSALTLDNVGVSLPVPVRAAA